jgi:hypothetical protein
MHWVRRVCDEHGFSIRRPTHIAQNATSNVDLCMDWVDHVRSQATFYEISDDRIVNMDETNVYFDQTPKSTITKRGSKQVNLKKPAARHGNRLTAALAGE